MQIFIVNKSIAMLFSVCVRVKTRWISLTFSLSLSRLFGANKIVIFMDMYNVQCTINTLDCQMHHRVLKFFSLFFFVSYRDGMVHKISFSVDFWIILIMCSTWIISLSSNRTKHWLKPLYLGRGHFLESKMYVRIKSNTAHIILQMR